ncbi:MAG: DUF2846 domain-containing protein [gamma proteobacterium symbiont of Ctena orbiculata]|nr:DUF2846 domain-containing protein [Candidatus Thiodiazotropha taylori]MBT3058238.1 DUF2846 domain-containing protein [Candidatus Thiodiazotropha sp. (ex Lucina pensylvanica)]MBV2093433.1 DUF2846 domain-containing protein [Candidatus Thiodiazotropha sp. (ex Codakia orbicularis)]PUB72496.1 MAG: hypothetical protein DBP03_17045 [gamma proteobacterium symbiont of Ctena orbiculata]MBT3062770.1 DUF2846 domain-containing protein [Candidatus Thiodiazotropha sp. (ex Lucina pensylvanica)]
MFKRMAVISLLSLSISGCASVQMSSEQASNLAKSFNKPGQGQAGIYIYRKKSIGGGSLKKDVWIDGKCIGETAPGVFFYEEVAGDASHTISTESEFSPNELVLATVSGENYFIKQYIKIGVFVGGANLEQVDEETGRKEIMELGMATKGQCSEQ